MEEPKNAKLFLALKSRYALHNTDRLVEFILDDQKTSFDFITEIIPQTCKGKYPLNDANIANEVRLIEVYLADKVWDLVGLAYMDQR